jgi:hypothetical protein
MRSHRLLGLLGWLAAAGLAWGQEPLPVLAPRPAALAPPDRPDDAQRLQALRQELASNADALARARAARDDAVDPKEVERLKKQVEILQKQIEVLQKLVDLLAEQIKKQPAGPAVAKLQEQTAALESRSVRSAQRDQELANALDDLREHADAQERAGPSLPPTLKEMFFPSQTNETTLSIYGELSSGYSKILGNSFTAANGAGRPATPGGFYFGEFTPDFYLLLNDWIFLESQITAGGDGAVNVGYAQADFFVNDWLTIVAGRFIAPIGWYNLELNHSWVNKLPNDTPGAGPLLWQQVLPTLTMLGLQARGSFYLGCSPLKLDYAAYVSNGLNLTPAAAGNPTLSELANLQNMENTLNNITNEKTVGGRIGLWWPEMGLEAGASGLYNGDYVRGPFEESISLFAFDFNYRQGGLEVRAEYGTTYQQAGSFLGAPIRREGFYAQAAYRPLEASCKYVQNTEVVYRYSYVTFPGINANQLDLTTFATPLDVPVRRQQNEFGINYYFYPRMMVKVAYQINDEPNFHLHDNQFIAELDWGW